MASGAAAEQVFRLPELLEIILAQLSQKDLLLSQRVNSAFRNTVRYSPKLQKALFFVPDWELEGRAFNAYAVCNRPGRKPENNRLLLRAFPGCYPTVTLVITSANTDMHNTASDDDARRRTSEQWSWDVCISFPADSTPCCSPAVHYPEASWRRMYLSQPPCTTLHLVRRWQRSLTPAIVRDAGITMGDFVGEATKTQTKWHRSYISSDRDWHFEGNIKCSSIRERVEGMSSAGNVEDVSFTFPEHVFTYVHSRTLRQRSVRTLSDDWNPSQIVGVGSVVTPLVEL